MTDPPKSYDQQVLDEAIDLQTRIRDSVRTIVIVQSLGWNDLRRKLVLELHQEVGALTQLAINAAQKVAELQKGE